MVIRARGRFMVENGRQEWGRRMNQAALIARSIIEEQGTAAGKQLPNLERIQPHAHRAFELLEAWVQQADARAAGPVYPARRHDRLRAGGDRVLEAAGPPVTSGMFIISGGRAYAE
jgi:hypothetical protein